MDVISTLQDTDWEDAAQRALHGARDIALDRVIPASSDRLRDLADRLKLDKYRDQVQHLERDVAKRTKKLERKLERKAKHLPVDTPLDRRRRRRARRRGASTVGTLVVLSAVAAAAYLAWRTRRSGEADSSGPDHASTRAGDGTSDTEQRGLTSTDARADARTGHSVN